MARPADAEIIQEEGLLAVHEAADGVSSDGVVRPQIPRGSRAVTSTAVGLLLVALTGVAGWTCWKFNKTVAFNDVGGANGVVDKYQKVWAYLKPGSQYESCARIEDNTDYPLELIATVENVKSASMCCAACTGFPGCGAWTWGKNYKKEGVGGTCWVKKHSGKSIIDKVKNTDVMSGIPHPKVKKFGVEPAPASTSGKFDGVTQRDVGQELKIGATCPGKFAVAGRDSAVVLANTFNSSTVEVLKGDAVVSHYGARSYWAEWCNEGTWQPQQYVKLQPLGKTLRFTADISGTTCGCNAAFYLSAMPQNTKPGTCHGDYYCDVMSVCGVPCFELDLMEANQYAWRSTLHAVGDYMGKPMGYGGSEDSPVSRDWTSKEYSPGGKCIDTNKPFSVAISFPTDEQGNLRAFELELSQQDKPCTVKASITEYSWGWPPPRKNGWGELTKALQMGMTPVMSYWSSPTMLWMDGLGEDGRGPCVKDNPSQCPEYVRWYNFSLEDYRARTTSKW
eukprot:CAMPEP_0172666736 /NCGR_PEP_ID=MMETSP1074-20121228/7992_1 /TAXON_ID=2916 /ORGANISM="Ceratium fusus, Strain PA161109" /LENGTH=505 /DNA_ID=CAMNT_0013483157 /DNA_START=57 /DNA_END=1571 /DNA_ORIENTATION=-